jgi:glycosyltransferase involved in cell wall biosynthesis
MEEKKPLLQLVMIVKNSGKEIVSMLEKNKPYIDYWTILDTGSTDGTQERIRETMKDLPGELFEEPFVDFEYSRNRSLDLAGEKCEWYIILDDTYIIVNGEKLRNYLKKDCKDKDNLTVTVEDKKSAYPSLRIIRSNTGYRYKYRVHEIIIVPSTYLLETDIASISDSTESKYMENRSQERYKRDYKMLKEDFEKDPKDGRLCSYLAKTCGILNKKEESLKYFKKRLKIGGDPNEIYEAQVYITNYKSNNKVSEKDILEIYKKYPNAQLSVRNVVGFYHSRCKYELAFKYALEYFSKNLDKDNIFFNNNKGVYEELTYMYVDLCFLTNNIDFGIKLLKNILNEQPDNIPIRNIKNCVVKPFVVPIKLELKTFVIHSGSKEFIVWDPTILNTKISGSEYMTKNISEQMSLLGFRCFVFGNFDFDKKIHNNVEYINYKYFIEFADNYVIDYLIISRKATNLYYGYGVKNAYIWVHDILLYEMSYNNFLINQNHKTKFKKVLALSKWHKNMLVEENGIPENKITITRNGILTERFSKDIKKQPFRFIYSSTSFRGLTTLLNFFKKIKQRYPQAELYLFCSEEDLDIEQTNLINSTTGVIKNDRISQEQIAIEYLKSDIWFYPTNFLETYCITALEAQMARVLCFTTNVGSLSEIVGNRGITYSPDLEEDKILEKLYFVLDNTKLKNSFIERAYEWAIKQDIPNLAREWLQIFEENE